METSQTIEILSLWSPGQALSELYIPLFPSPTFEPLSSPSILTHNSTTAISVKELEGSCLGKTLNACLNHVPSQEVGRVENLLQECTHMGSEAKKAGRYKT